MMPTSMSDTWHSWQCKFPNIYFLLLLHFPLLPFSVGPTSISNIVLHPVSFSSVFLILFLYLLPPPSILFPFLSRSSCLLCSGQLRILFCFPLVVHPSTRKVPVHKEIEPIRGRTKSRCMGNSETGPNQWLTRPHFSYFYLYKTPLFFLDTELLGQTGFM